MGRVTLPEASHVSPDVASDAFVVLKTRIPAQATVAEDPHRRLHSTVAASAVVVVDVNLHSSHCFFSHLFRRGYQYRKDPPAEHTRRASSSRHAHRWLKNSRAKVTVTTKVGEIGTFRGCQRTTARAFTRRRTTKLFLFWPIYRASNVCNGKSQQSHSIFFSNYLTLTRLAR